MRTAPVQFPFRLALLLLVIRPACVQGDDGPAYLDDKEALVGKIANFSLANFLNREALAADCESQCSRRVCGPLLRDLQKNALICETVPHNPDCQGPNNGSCTTMLVSSQEAYVRLSPRAEVEAPTCDMRATICAQRELDAQIFKTANVSHNFELQGWTYFGSSNGIQRIYPGKELNETACSTYELRKRPWYVGATAVEKEIKVMLDFGPTMGSPLTNLAIGNKQNVFNATRNITVEFLDTLYQGDQVSVYTFGSGPPEPTLVGETVVVQSRTSVDDTALFEPLKERIVDLPNPMILDVRRANLTACLMQALQDFDSIQLKIVVIITAGDMVGLDLPQTLLDSLKAKNVRIFIYRLLGTQLGNKNGQDKYTQNLRDISCSIDAWYEEGLYDPQDPLRVVQSFYSYVAKLRFDLNGQIPFWVPRYEAHSGIGDLITVAHPVFSGNFMVGVAGVDLMVDNLKDITSDVTALLSERNTVFSVLVNDTPMAISCGQTLLGPQESTCPGALSAAAPGLTGLCTSDVDNNPNKLESLKERTCCADTCPWRPPHTSRLSTPSKIGIIFGSLVGGAIVLILFGIFCKPWRFCGSCFTLGSRKLVQTRDGDQSPKGGGVEADFKYDEPL